MATGAKRWLQELRCGCRSKDVAVGAKKWLHEPICSCNSQFMTTGAKLWLQEQDVAAIVKMWLQDKLLKSSFSVICCNFIV